MTPARLEAYLADHIPLSVALGIQVEACGPDEVVLRLPLAPNRNHQGTAFGGSLAAGTIGAAWCLTVLRLAAEGIDARVVIQREEMEFVAPVDGDFTVRAWSPAPDAWEAFRTTLARRRRARIRVEAVAERDGRVGARLAGWFVAFADQPADMTSTPSSPDS